MQDFVICTINEVQKKINGTYRFVRFTTTATTTVTNVTTASNVINKVNTKAWYSGGWKNTADGFQECQTVLGSGGNRSFVFLTDENPTACRRTDGCSSSCPSTNTTCTESVTTFASTKAASAQANNITMVSIGVGSGIADANLLNWTGDSSDLVLSSNDFTALDSESDHHKSHSGSSVDRVTDHQQSSSGKTVEGMPDHQKSHSHITLEEVMLELTPAPTPEHKPG